MEIDVPGGIDQVVEVFLLRDRVGVKDRDCGGFDGDAALALQVHIVKELGFHFPLGDGPGAFQQPIGQRGLAMVDVGDDAEVANLNIVGHGVPFG